MDKLEKIMRESHAKVIETENALQTAPKGVELRYAAIAYAEAMAEYRRAFETWHQKCNEWSPMIA